MAASIICPEEDCLYYRPLLYFVPELDIFDNVAPSKDELLSPKFWFEEDLVENGILEAAEDKEYFYNLGGFFSSLYYEEKSVFELEKIYLHDLASTEELKTATLRFEKPIDNLLHAFCELLNDSNVEQDSKKLQTRLLMGMLARFFGLITRVYELKALLYGNYSGEEYTLGKILALDEKGCSSINDLLKLVQDEIRSRKVPYILSKKTDSSREIEDLYNNTLHVMHEIEGSKHILY